MKYFKAHFPAKFSPGHEKLEFTERITRTTRTKNRLQLALKDTKAFHIYIDDVLAMSRDTYTTIRLLKSQLPSCPSLSLSHSFSLPSPPTSTLALRMTVEIE